MAIRPVLRLGDPRLFKVASAVEKFNTTELDNLINDMFDTMAAENGAGLAAPQIGEDLRVIIFGFDQNPRYPQSAAIPETVLINPEITPLANHKDNDWEGCLSVPGMRGLVPRFTSVRYSGYDASGNQLEAIAEGFHARVLQHECDHLDGIIYTQRLCSPKKFGFTEELINSGQLNTAACTE